MIQESLAGYGQRVSWSDHILAGSLVAVSDYVQARAEVDHFKESICSITGREDGDLNIVACG